MPQLIKRVGAALFAAVTVGFVLLLGRDTLYGYTRFGFDDGRISPLEESQAQALEWTDEPIHSPNGRWSAVVDDYDTISLQREPPSNIDIVLEHRDPDLLFQRIAWINDDTLAIEGQLTTDEIIWLRWDWRRNRIVPDGEFDQTLKGLIVASIGGLAAAIATFWLYRPSDQQE